MGGLGLGSGRNMGKPFKNKKSEERYWVEAGKIFSAIEALGYEIHEACEDFNFRPKKWTLVFSKKKKK